MNDQNSVSSIKPTSPIEIFSTAYMSGTIIDYQRIKKLKEGRNTLLNLQKNNKHLSAVQENTNTWLNEMI